MSHENEIPITITSPNLSQDYATENNKGSVSCKQIFQILFISNSNGNSANAYSPL